MRTLELHPAMTSPHPPDWPGALWVGALDVHTIAGFEQVHLRKSDGYTKARLLVCEGPAVRGFIELDAPNGLIARAELDDAIAVLPRSQGHVDAVQFPTITVIVCTRDRPSQLRGALTAIFALDYPNFDVLVVDNASRTSETRDLVQNEFAASTVSLVREPTPGLGVARNTGLRAATGEIVAYTDDDVIVDAAWLTELSAGFSRGPNVDCVTGLVPSGELRTPAQSYFDGRVSWSKNLVPRTFSLADPPSDLPMFPFSIGEFGTGANFALRRSAALELGGFDTALGVGTRTGGGEDIDMFTRVILDGRTLVTQPSAIVWHRNRDDIAALRLQARGYGTGLGAWLAKLFTHPRTARLALVRGPRALTRLVSLAWRRPAPVAGARLADDWEREIARIGWVELLSVARGPLSYLLQRRSGKAQGND
ncbi:MAG TPA: glycosyltransferase [Pseudolysinimonas sp.]|nr:glycosyltransferase [Pseudolysinimonas sp.]